ncbi:MAG: hypothetical protein ACLSUW_10910, partial [Akkermansia sp.]
FIPSAVSIGIILPLSTTSAVMALSSTLPLSLRKARLKRQNLADYEFGLYGKMENTKKMN